MNNTTTGLVYQLTCAECMAGVLKKFLQQYGRVIEERKLRQERKRFMRFQAYDLYSSIDKGTAFIEHGALTVDCEQPYIRGLHGE